MLVLVIPSAVLVAVESNEGKSGVERSVEFIVVHTGVVTVVMRPSVDHTGRPDQIQSISGHPAQCLRRSESSMVSIVHYIYSDLTTGNTI